MKKNARIGRSLLGWLQDGFALSKTIPFIFGLVTSHVLMQNAVVDVMMDFLTDEDGHHQSLWKAAILTNLVHMTSAVLEVAITHVSDTYTGPFTVIIFCATAYAMGLMLLGFRGMLIFAMVLIALGKAGKERTSEFFYNQLMREKLNKKRTEEGRHRPGFLWHFIASFTGNAIAIFWLGHRGWLTRFKISSLVMEIMCLLFFFGIFFYYSELRAIKSKESSSKNSSDAESEDRVEVVRTEEQVRDLKSLYPPITLLGFTFIAYSLVFTCGNTYFVVQTNVLDSNVGEFDVPVIVFFVLQSSVASIVGLIQSKYKLIKPIWSMAVGMFCSVLCGIAAFLVERRRLDLIQFRRNQNGRVSLSIWVLTPQYLLLGLMEGLAGFELERFLRNQLMPEPMKKFVYPGIQILFGIGTFFSILFALVFVPRIRLDWCFLILASVSFVFFLIYVCLARFLFAKFQAKGVLERPASSDKSRSSPSSDAQPSQQENGEAASHLNQDNRLGRSKTIKRKTSGGSSKN